MGVSIHDYVYLYTKSQTDPGMIGDVTGKLLSHECGIVITVSRSDGSLVYILGPDCIGWGFSAFLRHLEYS